MMLENTRGVISKSASNSLKGIAILMIFLSHIPQAISIPGHFGKLLAPMGYHGVSIFCFFLGMDATCHLKISQLRPSA